MNTRFEQVPSGFITDWATPLDDFRGKLDKVEYVVDAGSPYQDNRSFAGDNKLWVGQLPDAAGLPAVNTGNLGSLDPLQVEPTRRRRLGNSPRPPNGPPSRGSRA